MGSEMCIRDSSLLGHAPSLLELDALAPKPKPEGGAREGDAPAGARAPGVALPELGGAAAAVAPPPPSKPAAATAAAAPNPDPDSCCAFVRSELATTKEELAAARAEAARLYDLIEKGKYALAGVGVGVLSAVIAVRLARK